MGCVEITTPDPAVTLVTLSRPDALNALTGELVEELHEAIDTISADLDCRVVVLTGAGRAFSVGLDLRGYGDDDRGSRYGDHGYKARSRGGPSAQQQLAASGRLRGGVGNRAIPSLDIGDRVTHDSWGMGRVVATRGAGEGAQAQIDFGGDVGLKWLMLRYAPVQKL